MIVSAGEALVDLLPTVDRDGRPAFCAMVGGSPFNVAIGLGRLGVPAAFLGAVSYDAFGDRLVTALVDSAVSTTLVARVARPTPLAFVTLDGGEARYAFYDSGTAARDMTTEELAPLPRETTVLHVGSIALASDPAAATILGIANTAREQRLVCLDPNVRPAFAADEVIYRRNLAAAMGLADLIRLSATDLAWLAPGIEPRRFAQDRMEAGATLVVVTKGAAGATAYTPAGPVEVTAPTIEVVDTVGAGDAFTAGLLTALHERGVQSRADLAGLGREALHEALEFAAAVAAAACTRAGADLPRRAEIDITEGMEQP